MSSSLKDRLNFNSVRWLALVCAFLILFTLIGFIRFLFHA